MENGRFGARFLFGDNGFLLQVFLERQVDVGAVSRSGHNLAAGCDHPSKWSVKMAQQKPIVSAKDSKPPRKETDKRVIFRDFASI